MIELVSVTKKYVQGIVENIAVRDITYRFSDVGLFSIIGESGCGKTTLLNVIGGMDKPDFGDLLINGIDTKSFSERDWDEYRNKSMGFVFQDYNVFDTMSVAENILLPLQVCTIRNFDETVELKAIAEKMGITDLLNQRTGTLSGGQKQRVALARAVIKEPEVLLADEPTGNLDSENSDLIFELLKQISQETLVIVVTHDKERAERYSDVVISMADGSFVDIADAENNHESLAFSFNGEQRFFSDLISLKKAIREWREKTGGSVIETCLLKTTSHEHTDVVIRHKKDKNAVSINRKHIKKYAGCILYGRRLRRLLTTVMTAIAMVLLLLPMAVFNYSQPITEQIYSSIYKDDYVLAKQVTPYFTLEGDSKNLISNTQDNLALLQNVVPAKYIIYKTTGIQVNPFTVYEEGDGLGMSGELFTVFVLSDELINERSGNSIDPSVPTVLFTDYVANKLGVTDEDFGELFCIGFSTAVFQGIVNSDYKDIVPKLDENDDRDNYILDNIYNVVFANKAVISSLFASADICVWIESNYFFAKTPYNYLSGEYSLCGASMMNTEIEYGRAPQTRNEIVISGNKAQRLGIHPYDGEFIEIEYSLRDIYSEQYLENYLDIPNMYQILGSNVRVVGISNNMYADIAVLDDAYLDLVQMETDLFGYDGIGIAKEVAWQYIEKMGRNGLILEDPNAAYSVNYINDCKTLIPFAIVAFIAAFILLVGTIVSEIRYEIKDNYRSIGILRAIGVSKRDIGKIFLIFPKKMICISTILGIFCSLAVWLWLNLVQYKYLEYRKFFILWFEIWPFAVALLFIICFALLMAWLPICEIKKKTLIGVIKN